MQLRLRPLKGLSRFEVVGPEGCEVHISGYSFLPPAAKASMAAEKGSLSKEEKEWLERQRKRKLRVEELQREAEAEAKRPCTLPARRSTQLSDEYMAAVARDGEPVVLPGWLQTMVAAFDEAQAS